MPRLRSSSARPLVGPVAGAMFSWAIPAAIIVAALGLSLLVSGLGHAQEGAAPPAPPAPAGEGKAAPSGDAAKGTPADAAQIAEIDKLWATRADGDNAQKMLDKARAYTKAFPNDYEGFWRLARACFWVAERYGDQEKPDSDKQAAIGDEGWKAGIRAQELNPGRVEGWYYGATCLGQHARGVGIMTAFFQGLGSKFEEQINKAITIDPTYNMGGPWRTLGRYYYTLPRIKRDLAKSTKLLTLATKKYPQKLRGRFYLAETLEMDDKLAEARAEYEACAKADPNAEDPADGAIFKARCEAKLKEMAEGK